MTEAENLGRVAAYNDIYFGNFALAIKSFVEINLMYAPENAPDWEFGYCVEVSNYLMNRAN
jgi:hypothetical protein